MKVGMDKLSLEISSKFSYFRFARGPHISLSGRVIVNHTLLYPVFVRRETPFEPDPVHTGVGKRFNLC